MFTRIIHIDGSLIHVNQRVEIKASYTKLIALVDEIASDRSSVFRWLTARGCDSTSHQTFQNSF